MRILRVIASLDPRQGGPIEGLLRSTAAIDAMGHTTEVACLDAPDSPWLASLPFAVQALGPGTRRYGYSARLTPWIRANRRRFDAVVLHGLWNYSSVGAWRALRGTDTPYVIFTHGMLDPWFRTAYPLKHWVKQAYWTAFEGRVLRDARSVLFTTAEEMRLAENVFAGHRYRGRVVAYGTADIQGDAGAQVDAFATRAPGLAGRRFLLFLSRIHPKKGCDLLIDAFGALAAREPDLDLVMAGPDQVGWRAELQSRAAAAGIGDRIHWPGMLEGDAKWGAFRACEAFVLPSHQENFGIVVAEALAAGRPVLVTDKVNIWREVVADDAGLVGTDDAEGVSSLLSRFIAMSREERGQMASRARASFLARYEIGGVARSLVAALEDARA